MKRLVFLALYLIVNASASTERAFTATVVGITDGDTITVLRDQVSVKVRLVEIDAP